MADKPKYYWDACAWIALIQQEPQRFDSLNYVIELARKNEAAIWTSNFTLAEVYKPYSGEDGKQLSLLPQHDKTFEDFILQPFVERVQVDFDIGVLARKLLRKYPAIKKPQDGIHLATALLNNIDELHTYDRENLLDLSEKIERRDGKKLKICHPPVRPKPKPAPAPLFDGIENEDAKKAAEGGGTA
ncbi:MAG: PIN domain-containing protein [Xanthobacteraceae bacterium]|nr:PIN domain-containing protein [Xanthobacteraceae bacterium]